MLTRLLCLLFCLSISFTTLKAEVFRVLDQEQEALQCRIDLMARAKTEILLATYIIKEDDIGLSILELLTQAAARGVKVKVILDSFGREVTPSLLNFLAEKGVEVHLFNRPNLLKLHTFHNRMHGKMLIVDNESTIIGGRNLTEEYFELDPIGNFLDREVYANSLAAAADVRFHFFTMWNNSKITTKEDKIVLSDSQRFRWTEKLSKAWFNLQVRKLVVANSATLWSESRAVAQPIFVTYDHFNQEKNGEFDVIAVKDCRSSEHLVYLIDAAQHSIDIENPYFHPTPRWEAAFKRAIARGVKIRLFTNSECTNDVGIMQAIYRRIRPKYLKMGFEIWEYEGQKRVHTKAFVIDQSQVIVGSYNIHSVSEKNNTEVCIWTKDTTIAAQCIQIMEDNCKLAQPIHTKPAYFKTAAGAANPKCGFRSGFVNFCIYTFAPLMSWMM